MDKINTLVFEGGGIYGYAYIGALKELQTRIDFTKIKYLCGSSAGALIAYACDWPEATSNRTRC